MNSHIPLRFIRATLAEAGIVMAGYSGTPLVKKLGFKAPLTVTLIDPPQDYAAWLGDLPAGVKLTRKPAKPLRAVHLFATEQAMLRK